MRLLKLSALAFIMSLIFSSCTVHTAHVTPRHRVVAVKSTYPKAVIYKNVTYYHKSGTWYKKRSGKYIVIAPPAGIRVTVLPKGYKVVNIRKVRYYKYNGIYYKRSGRHFTVVHV